MVTIIGRTTNTNKGTLNRRKKMVQYHACKRNNRKYIRIINSLSWVQLWTIYFLYYFSLIYVYMFTNLVFIHILHKIYKKESQKTHNCIPYRLEPVSYTHLRAHETSLNLKLLDKSQSDDVSIKPLHKIQMPLKGLKENKIIIIMVIMVIGRITNTNKGTLNRRKKMVQCHACNKNTWKYIRIKNSLSCVQLGKLSLIHI